MKSLIPPSIIIGMALFAMPALSQEHEGRWEGPGEGNITLDLTHTEGDDYAASLSTLVPISNEFMGCAGGIDGEVTLDNEGGTLRVENEGFIADEPESGLNARYCEISFEFNADGSLTVQEEGGCLYYHGASCSFTGTLEPEASGI